MSDKPASQSKSSAMWGGRFEAGPSAVMEAINASIDIDKRMADQDIDGSLAHAQMLGETGVISSEDAAAIRAGLEQVRAEIHAGDFAWSKALEDVHMNVEARLKAIIGEPAGRLHTARSRNDQVATDFRLWLRDACDRIDAMLAAYQKALLDQAAQHVDQVMPGFTHLQTAQPVSLAHHLLSYVEVAQRDRGRFADARKRLNESPLGCAALAGTAFPIDREMTARALGFDRPMANSLDGVAARDFALEVLSAASICAVNLSRFAEEIVLWCTRRFGFATLPAAAVFIVLEERLRRSHHPELPVTVPEGDRDDPVDLGPRSDVLIAFPGHVVRRIADPEHRIEQKLHRPGPRTDDQVGAGNRIGKARPCPGPHLFHAQKQRHGERDGQHRHPHGQRPRQKRPECQTEDHATALFRRAMSSSRTTRSNRAPSLSSWLTIRSEAPEAAIRSKSRPRNVF